MPDKKLTQVEVVARYLPSELHVAQTAEAFAPSNIALCKYWGKRDRELNLPLNASLSVSLAHLGTRTTLSPAASGQDEVLLNGQQLDKESGFARKISTFLNLFRREQLIPLRIDTHNNIPTAAGLASSASGFAALMLAVDQLFNLQLEKAQLSAFARMGSGSAARSLYQGFVQWQMGEREDGMDSYGFALDMNWPDLRVGLVKVSTAEKPVDSRSGMERTLASATLYQSWPRQAAADLERMRAALKAENFVELGAVAEHNALSMHATMIASWPPLVYWQPESLACMQKVWQLRSEGLELFFTMDAGPNLKLLFLADSTAEVQTHFPDIEIVAPFGIT